MGSRHGPCPACPIAHGQHSLPEPWWGPGDGHQGHGGIRPCSNFLGEITRFINFLCPNQVCCGCTGRRTHRGRGMRTKGLIQQSMSQPFEWKQSKQQEIGEP